ncbi:hypothetical protein BJ165DRAFT_1609311 [Panaeolus papilionaceus]|nr:hypothetical protein BJ165DRAFT_1609311 [Panaeolus papilionaceus]
MANPNSPDQPEWGSLSDPSSYHFFTVENQLFCVPVRCILFKGSFFEEHLLVEGANLNAMPGFSKEIPLVINGVSVDAFREFLRVVYPHADVDPPSSPEEWLRVLEVATELKVSKIRERAIIALNTHIENASFHERVVHGSRYGVADWLRQGLRGVVTSDLWCAVCTNIKYVANLCGNIWSYPNSS